MSRALGAIGIFALAVACGGKDKPEPLAATAAPVTTAPVAQTAAAERDTTTSPAPHAATTTAPPGTTAPPAPAAKALDPAVQAAIDKGAPSCIGFSRDGMHAVFLFRHVVDGDERWLLFEGSVAEGDSSQLEIVASCERGDKPDSPPCAKQLAASYAEDKASVVEAARARELVPCRARAPVKGEVKIQPLGKAGTVSSSNTSVDVAIDDGHATEMDVFSEVDELRVDVLAAYDSDKVGSLFVVVGRSEGGEREPGEEPADIELAVLSLTAEELGVATCRPIPKGTVAAASPPPFVVDGDLDCLAMTADGKAALIRTETVTGGPPDPESDEPEEEDDTGVDWYPSGPDIDASCHEGRACDTPKAKAALLAAAKKHGLVGCAEAHKIRVGGQLFEHVSVGDKRHFLKRPDSETLYWFHTLTIHPDDGGDHEALDSMFQHPAGGPLFMLINNADTGLQSQSVTVLSPGDLGFCKPPAPAVAPGTTP